MLLVFLVSKNLALGRIKSKVADRSYDAENSARNRRKENISKNSSAGITLGLQASVVDNKASDPA